DDLQAGGSAALSCARRHGGAGEDREMRSRSGQRHAVARKLLQQHNRQVRSRHAYPARGRTADAADANCRPSPGTAEGKDIVDLVGTLVAGDCGPTGETRADDLVFKSPRVFDVTLVQQLRRSARLSELQRRADVSSAVLAPELPPLRPYRGRAEEMSRLRERRADLCR